jgi:molybdopterin-guanine dinucleotide biosynthesis protein A
MAGNGNSDGLAGILLTGGASRRMGESKTALLIEGRRLADLVGSKVAVVASPVVEVGPGARAYGRCGRSHLAKVPWWPSSPGGPS